MLVLLLHLGVVIAWLLAIAGVLAFWCPWLELCNEFRPFALIATVILVLAALALRDGSLLVGSISAFAVTLVLFLLPLTTGAERRNNALPVLRVVTFNIEATNTQGREIGQFIAGTNADIVVIQEIDAATMTELLRELGKVYLRVFHTARDRSTGLALLAKHACADGGHIAWSDSNPALNWARIQKGSFSCEVIGVYLAYPFHPRKQARHMDWLIAYVRSRSHPLIVAGDFNLTPFSAKLNKFAIATGLRRHATLLASWPADKFRPVFLIDHVFASSEFCSVQVAMGPSVGSDHRPVIADIGIKAK
jgi:endonuclease/exonuclease/phosphatase (EEP) superfamily protein YafD